MKMTTLNRDVTDGNKAVMTDTTENDGQKNDTDTLFHNIHSRGGLGNEGFLGTKKGLLSHVSHYVTPLGYTYIISEQP